MNLSKAIYWLAQGLKWAGRILGMYFSGGAIVSMMTHGTNKESPIWIIVGACLLGMTAAIAWLLEAITEK